MIYMVELDWQFDDQAREAEWEKWYEEHLNLLLSVPGFGSAQRVRAVTPMNSANMAIYSINSMDVFESERYRAVAGPRSSKEYHSALSNWFRNAYEGAAMAPKIANDELLILLDSNGEASQALPWPTTWLTAAGFERKPARRGFAVIKKNELDKARGLGPGLRIFEPLTPYLQP